MRTSKPVHKLSIFSFVETTFFPQTSTVMLVSLPKVSTTLTQVVYLPEFG